ncbi:MULTISPECIES: JAB domain-containing protein [Bacillaceae]|uniref:JAB domain-containing protein n=1 Tax=Bacteria TaxID=2 RepID=UPI000BF1EB02|nr:hypothetical protein CN592_11765 [Bacillus toyonensis]TNO85940.1 hypothetical protein FHR08_27740 [Bacillus cereus]
MIVVYNHPSENPAPSSKYIDVTNRLEKSCTILGINLLNPIITCTNNFCSLKEKGDIK